MRHNPSSRRPWLPPAQRTEEAHGFSTLPSCHLFLHLIALAAKTGKLSVLGAAWYKKSDPTFSDCLATVRRILWAEEAVRPILWRDDFPTWRSRARTTEKPRPLQQRQAELMSYAA